MIQNKIYDNLAKKINNKAWTTPVQKYIIDNCYKFFFEDNSQWKEYFSEPYYIIGLSEDKYDYYWLCIDNKEKKLKFVTCLYKIDVPYKGVCKSFNKEERKNIFEYVKKYFKDHAEWENLIYLDEKLYK